MSKGIIVVDMPNKCCTCRMGYINEYYDQFECYFNPGAELKPDENKPDWCPIKPLPKKDTREYMSRELNFLKKGWNDCIDEIQKRIE